MLLIDGVKYQLWTPSSEDELEQMVIEHAQDIFGENSIYFDKKQKLRSLAGVGSIPDGYVILLTDKPEWFIVEVELSQHDVFGHIVPQVGKFTTGIKNLSSRKTITNIIFEQINKEEALRGKVENRIGSEIYKFLDNLISQPPKLLIVIDRQTEELNEAIDVVRIGTEVVEFSTFVNENNKSQRAYLFTPLATDKEGSAKEFLNNLCNQLKSRRADIKPSRPGEHLCKINMGHRDIHLEWLVYGGKQRLGVELHLERAVDDENSQLLTKLKGQSAELERRVGESLVFQSRWYRGKKWSRVYTARDIEETSGFYEWAVETMIKFYDVFKPLLGEID